MRRRGTFERTSSRIGWDDEKVRRPLIVFEAENRAQHRRQIESLESILGAVLLPVNIVLNGGRFNLLATPGLRKRLRFHSALALPGDESKFLEQFQTSINESLLEVILAPCLNVRIYI